MVSQKSDHSLDHQSLRGQRGSGQEQDGVLIDPVEQHRREQRGETAAQRPAGGDDQIEKGQLRGVGAQRVEPSVERHREHEQQPDHCQRDRRVGLPTRNHRKTASRQQQHRRHPGQDPGPVTGGGKGHRKAQQIEAERDNPQQRHRHQVGGQQRGGREHQPRWHRRQRQPQQHGAESRALGARLRDWLGGSIRGFPAERNGENREQDQHAISQRPQCALRAQRQSRLEPQRIGEQPGETAQIGGRVERIGIARIRCRGEPALDQGGLRRHQ